MRDLATHWLGHDPEVGNPGARTTVLLVGSDQALLADVALSLDPATYAVRTVATGDEARAALADGPVDAVVLDSLLSEESGLALLGDLKLVHPAIPILLVGSTRRAQDVVVGLRLGADDVVARPMDPAEFRARLDAVLRRTSGSRSRLEPPGYASGLSEVNDLTIDHATGVASLGDTVLNLTRTEFSILAALVDSPGHVLSRKEIVEAVWGGRATPESRALDVHMGRVRRKLRSARRNAPTIVAIRLQAYRLTSGESSSRMFDQTADTMLGGRSV
jgi:two-component system response regulator QseB